MSAASNGIEKFLQPDQVALLSKQSMFVTHASTFHFNWISFTSSTSQSIQWNFRGRNIDVGLVRAKVRKTVIRLAVSKC